MRPVRPVVLGLLAAVLLVACSHEEGDHIATVFAPCEPLGLVTEGPVPDDTVASMDLTIAMWNLHGMQLTREPAAGVPTVPIRFEAAAGNFHGVYEDEIGVIFLNAGITDPHQRAVTLAHEVGHAFGLLHVDRAERTSVMNRGNVVTEPATGDRDALADLWGACP